MRRLIAVCDLYNLSADVGGEITMTLTAVRSDCDHVPVILEETDEEGIRDITLRIECDDE